MRNVEIYVLLWLCSIESIVAYTLFFLFYSEVQESSMTILRAGSTDKYSDNWENVFSGAAKSRGAKASSSGSSAKGSKSSVSGTSKSASGSKKAAPAKASKKKGGTAAKLTPTAKPAVKGAKKKAKKKR